MQPRPTAPLCALKRRNLLSVHVTNFLLASLSEPNQALLLTNCIQVPLPLRTSLYKADKAPTHGFFLTSGFASGVTTNTDGDSVEVGMIGAEGVVGGFHLLGPAKAQTDCFIQLEGTALRISMVHLREAFRASPEINARILEFVQSQALSLGQIAGCHRFHEAEGRLARWLLMAQDRAQSDVLNLTQEFLGMMLGARRTTVTMIAGAMQQSGLILYSRGKVTIPNRENLEAAACDCYPIVKALRDGLYRAAVPTH